MPHAMVAAIEEGRSWQSTYRKAIAATATVAGQWYDYSYASGNPIANYYAASPLEAAVLDTARGIIVPRMEGSAKQYLLRWSAMASSASAGQGNNQELHLLDYLLFYPFVDMDSKDPQDTIPSAALPRYTSGVGVQMMCVAQSITVGGGRFTITYTDSDGVQRTTPSLFCAAAQPPGALVHAVNAAGGLSLFVPLEAGVKGVRSVDSVTFSVANGGLMAVVLVKPLAEMWESEAARTSSSDGTGEVVEKEWPRCGPPPAIQDGAFLGIVGRSTTVLTSNFLTGLIETVWR